MFTLGWWPLDGAEEEEEVLQMMWEPAVGERSVAGYLSSSYGNSVSDVPVFVAARVALCPAVRDPKYPVRPASVRASG